MRAHGSRARRGGSLLAVAAFCALASAAALADEAKVDLAKDKVGTPSEMQPMSKFCGTKDIKVALADGYGSNSWRKITRAEFESEAKKCPTIKEIRYTDAQGNVQKAISDIQGLVAQKFDVILVFPDGGEAVIRAMRKATSAGAVVIPYMVGAHFPGERGKDYEMVVTESVEANGRVKAQWIADHLNGKGNVIVLGGTPGNPTSAAEAVGWKEVFAKYPGIKVLEGPVTTNWDPAETQRVMSGLLAKYDKIDAVYSDYGLGSMGALRAFVAAGRPIPLWAAQDANELGCFWQEHKAQNPNFQMGNVSGRNWIVRLALRKGVAAAEGIPNDEPSIIELPLVEDTFSSDPKLQPACDKSLPPDALLSSGLSTDELKALLK
ncbi:ABC transporter substrate-binding protein [Segnochrobactrum spirostomi]|uniref:Substrate-binding domain-containing protein n=1 Tax=Segnochrobactrum spirostomi TaxID=2608987 RepID=A0A6A7Y672_9HYPH|nr:ABC transporter substrate-binding protein [Segnochrobactrum spirostomi]MQT14780.1 substrate-binding domain-containing protein [Segnochrobactrum spirostomi]